MWLIYNNTRKQYLCLTETGQYVWNFHTLEESVKGTRPGDASGIDLSDNPKVFKTEQEASEQIRLMKFHWPYTRYEVVHAKKV